MVDNIDSFVPKRSITMSKNAKLWIVWGCMYLLCTACGFIMTAPGFLSGLFLLLSIGFFIPGGMLLWSGIQNQDHRTVKTVRLLSILSLSLTVLMIILNFATARDSAAIGTAMYWILIVVSTPMICSQVWVIGLFGWACLLMGSIFYQKK